SDDLGSGCSQGRWANDRVQLPGIGVLRDRGSPLADEGARLLAVHLHRLGGERKGARDSAVLIAVRRDLVRGLQALLHSRGARAVETGLEGGRAHLRRLVCPAQRGLRARHLAEAGVVRAQRTRSRSVGGARSAAEPLSGGDLSGLYRQPWPWGNGRGCVL